MTRGLVGTSDWVVVDQDRIDEFARVTGDEQWIHVDPERAATGPFGEPIAHGFLIVSLLPGMVEQAVALDDQTMGVNYGFNKVRFTSPVRSGRRIRAHCSIVDAEERNSLVLATIGVEIEIDQQTAPALVGEFLMLASDNEMED